MRRIYLIRHCQPAFPGGEKRCISATDLPLSQEGKAQAARLPRLEVAAVFSSPLTRCVQTAQALGQPVWILDGLRELGVGQWEGLTFGEIRQRYPEAYAARGLDPALPPPGGEDQREALARFCRAMDTALSQTPGDLAVVTHGGILERFLESVTGKRYKPGYGETVVLFWEDGQFLANC